MRQHKLMLQNNEMIFKQYLEMRVIEQSHALETNFQYIFLYETFKVLCVKGYSLIKRATLVLRWFFIKYWMINQNNLICTILNQKLFMKIRMICVCVIFPALI